MGMERIDLASFRYMLRQGRIVLLFDGFDELALRVNYERAAEHFETIVQAAAGDAKVIVTSRTQHFESESQVRTVLSQRAQPLPGLRYCKLLPFGESQIKQFLSNRWSSPEQAGEWFHLLHNVKDLLGLSENPRMLGFITELNKSDLLKAHKKEGVISAADLYRLLLERWLVHEYGRAHPPGSQVALSESARWEAVEAIAIRLWQKTDKFLTHAELIDTTTSAIQRVMFSPPPPDIAAHLIGSGSLLKRDDEGCFFFVHQSVMEWLVARKASKEIRDGGTSILLSSRPLSPLMADFFCDLAGQAASNWARVTAVRASIGADVTKNNALEVLTRSRGETVVLNLAGQDLRGKDFAGQSLVRADIRGADLTDARLTGVDLTGAQLDGAKLVYADFTGAILCGASLINADFSYSTLLGADLRGAHFAGSKWSRAKLVGAMIIPGAMQGLDTWGAALDGMPIIPEMRSPPSVCLAVTWSKDGSVIATGHENGDIQLWEANSGKPLRLFRGHLAAVNSVCFSPSGHILASGSDDGSVKLWAAENGQLCGTLNGHKGAVLSVAFDLQGVCVASASQDKTVILWDTESRKQVHLLEGHQNRVRSVVFDLDGQRLVSSGDDRVVKLWEAHSGKLIRTLEGFDSTIWCVAFDPQGKLLATASHHNKVKLWTSDGDILIRTLEGHKLAVLTVAFSPQPQRLASGSQDGEVKLWATDNGMLLRTFLGHRDWVSSVAFDPQGYHLASASLDKTIKLWATDTGKLIRTLEGLKCDVQNVTLASENNNSGTTMEKAKFSLVENGMGSIMAKMLRLPDGKVVSTPDGCYDFSGSVTQGFWHVIGLCRFEAGELDKFVPKLRFDAIQ
jgi:WD40 repeat protein